MNEFSKIWLCALKKKKILIFKNTIFYIILIIYLLLFSGCTFLNSNSLNDVQNEQTETIDDTPFGTNVTSSAQSLYINIPDTTSDPILNIPGKVATGQKLFINEEEVTVETDGTFVSTINLSPGKNIISIKVVSSDNKSTYSTGRSVEYIILGGNNPFIQLDSPGIPSQHNKNVLVIKGITEPNCIIDANGYKTLAEENGRFIVSVPLKDGDNLIKVVSTNKAGKTSTIQEVVNYDKRPTIIINDPALGTDPNYYISSDKITISGFTEPNNLVKVFTNPADVGNIQSSVSSCNVNNGMFSTEINLSTGRNEIVINAVNQFGKSSNKTIFVTKK